MTRAACTYSLLRSTSVEPRTVRAYCTQPVSAIARISTPKASASWRIREQRARRRRRSAAPPGWPGRTACTSQMRMMKASIRPPTKPASRPSATPISIDSSTDATPTTSEMRAPYISADRMSRPWSSVPSRYLALPPLDPCRRQARIAEFERRQVERVVRRDPARRTPRRTTQTNATSAAADRHRRGAEAVADVAVEPARTALAAPAAVTAHRQRRQRVPRPAASGAWRSGAAFAHRLDRHPLEEHVVVGQLHQARRSSSRPRPAPAGAAGCGRRRPGGS